MNVKISCLAGLGEWAGGETKGAAYSFFFHAAAIIGAALWKVLPMHRSCSDCYCSGLLETCHGREEAGSKSRDIFLLVFSPQGTQWLNELER